MIYVAYAHQRFSISSNYILLQSFLACTLVSDEQKHTQKYVIFVVAARVELVKHKANSVSQTVRRSASSHTDQALIQTYITQRMRVKAIFRRF